MHDGLVFCEIEIIIVRIGTENTRTSLLVGFHLITERNYVCVWCIGILCNFVIRMDEPEIEFVLFDIGLSTRYST